MSVYIIAEAGVNHNGDINLAKELVDVAKNAGCDCVKFQTFKADKIVTKSAERAKYQKDNTQSEDSQYTMLKKLELSESEFQELKMYCDKKEIDFLSTPFDEEAVDMLETIGVSQYKIPSGEITNRPLIKYIAKKKKPILMSTGMSDLEEVQEAVRWILEEKNEQIVLFHCTSNYPARYEDVNMLSMLTLKKEFGATIGYSDHTKGNEISIMAVSLGAQYIEKHFTLSRTMEGPDHKASLEPDELKKLVNEIRHAEKAFGRAEKSPTKDELETRLIARKSLVFQRDIVKGSVVTAADIVCKRPGTGIPPKYIDDFIGKKLIRDCYKDSLVKYSDVGETDR